MNDKVLCPWCGAEMFHPRPWQKGQPDMGGYNWTVQAKCRECGALSPKVYGRTRQEAENKLHAAALRRCTPPILCETCGAFGWDEPQCRNTDGTKYGRKECKYWSRKPAEEERSTVG